VDTLSAGVFALRPYRPDDADELVGATRESVATVGRWMPWCHAEYARGEADEWIAHTAAALAARSDFELALVDPADDRLVGGVGLNQFNPRNNFCNLGYWVRQSRQGRGAASAGAAALARFGFTALGLTRIEIVVQEGNAASARVAEKIGARREGVARNRLFILGVPVAAVVLGLVP
jgi:RimJ/RimL family protein N-acetyltransferase